MGFKEIALPLAAKGVPTTPVLPNSKRAFISDWPTSATTDPNQILAWDAAYPNHNGAAVAKGDPNGIWFLELDSPDVVKRIQEETGQEIPRTFRVRSRPGRGHLYWKNSPAAIAMGNLSQSYVKGADWSARVQNQYVVAPGSIHPHSQQPYVTVADDPIVECPDWLINWCISQKINKQLADATKIEPERDAFGLIPHGSIHGYMLREAGKLRAMGLGADEIYPALSALVHKNCAPPLNEDKIKTMAHSICNFPEGKPTQLLMSTPSVAALEEVEPLNFDDAAWPKFPRWVMDGTSIYENFVKPYCDVNNRIDYFMWIPAMIMLLNYVGPKIKIKSIAGNRDFKGAIYNIIIGKRGQAIKSSSVNDAKTFFNYMGCLVASSRDLKAAEGKTITSAVGSMESLGLAMQRTNAKSAILIYDELETLVSKAGIESSSLPGHLLTCYEGNTFENGVKSMKESFCIQPPYCVSLIACTTTEKFREQFSKIAGKNSGMDDRFTFILQPEELPAPRVWQAVNFIDKALKTRQLIDKAISQTEFAYEDIADPRLQELVLKDNRLAMRAEKWAVALAIDLGLTEIDGECIERAVALVKYERAVKKYMATYEAVTKEGQIQQEIRRTLEKVKGLMSRVELKKIMNYSRYGTTLWSIAYNGLIKNGIIREEGAGTKGDPIVVRLLEKIDSEDE